MVFLPDFSRLIPPHADVRHHTNRAGCRSVVHGDTKHGSRSTARYDDEAAFEVPRWPRDRAQIENVKFSLSRHFGTICDIVSTWAEDEQRACLLRQRIQEYESSHETRRRSDDEGPASIDESANAENDHDA